MTMLSNDIVNQFVIDVSLIEPIAKIVNQLKAGEFRDCDIKWLDIKLAAFIEFAAKTLGLQVGSMVDGDRSGSVMNDYNKNMYITKFNTLLEYFKSF